MPNHCDQTVTISGPAKAIYALELAVEHGSLLQTVIPMPFEKHADWYEWCCDNWGTKWDICESTIIDRSWNEDDKFWWAHAEEDDVYSFVFECWTAWAPPVPVWEKLVDMGLSVKASYVDEGGFFQGTYKDGVIDEVSEEFLTEAG
tara:strand:+ start:264 stop:701 length:438 start_codon:yes stop_codon:yes gene_type:complete